MQITKHKGKTENDIAYTELRIDQFYDYPITITFRAYTKNVWVVYTDDRNNWSSGSDLLNCWVADPVLFEKILVNQFDLENCLNRLCVQFDIIPYKNKQIVETVQKLKKT